MPHIALQHPALWALIFIGALLLLIALLLLRVRHENAKQIYRKHYQTNRPREHLLYASFGFYLSFASIRVITHAIHAGRGPFHDVSMGGRHIHHLVWGILILLLVGYSWLWEPFRNHPNIMGRLLSFSYGIGAGLTLDEFALWLNLRDVYWEREGRASIDAVLLFSALLSIGVFGGRFFRELTRAAFGTKRKRAARLK